MCTIAIVFGVAELPLVIAANRDELYARPTRPPERLAPGIAGGVDELSGGTWLALHASGRFAAVTNQRMLAAAPERVRSRGLAVRELAAADDPDAYVAALDPRAYASMNLAWGDSERASIAYLRHEGSKEVVALSRGIHVLTNDRLGSADFPRANRIADAIAAAPRDWPGLAAQLATILADHTTFDVPLPAGAPEFVQANRRALTATCIHTAIYGTRSATLAGFTRGAVAQYLHANGSPCTTPFQDVRGLLDA
jgi:uncharacterized protein with NRDE domain